MKCPVLFGLKWLVVGRIAIVHSGEGCWAFDGKMNQVVGVWTQIAVLVDHLDRDIRKIFAIGGDFLAIGLDPQFGRRPSGPDLVDVGLAIFAGDCF